MGRMLHALLVPTAPVAPAQAHHTPVPPRPRYRALARTGIASLQLRSARKLPGVRTWALCTVALVLLLLAAIPWAVQAQNIYRSVDAQGRITFSDRLSVVQQAAKPGAGVGNASAPKPETAAADGTAPAEVAEATQAADLNAAASLPYALRQARSKYPVTFYSTGDCLPCDDARRMLVQRGVPYTERSVISGADLKALQALSGQEQLPFATVGQQHLVGWDADSWQRYLDLAGYPSQSALPSHWKPSTATALAPQPAAPAQPATAAATTTSAKTASTSASQPAATAPTTSSAPKVNANNPAGITF